MATGSFAAAEEPGKHLCTHNLLISGREITLTLTITQDKVKVESHKWKWNAWRDVRVSDVTTMKMKFKKKQCVQNFGTPTPILSKRREMDCHNFQNICQTNAEKCATVSHQL